MLTKLTLLTPLLFFAQVHAAEPWIRAEVPQGVKVHTIADGVAWQKAAWLKEVLGGGKGRLFGGIVACGPGIWKDLKGSGKFGNKNAAVLTVGVPVGGTTLGLEGKVIRDPGEVDELQKTLVATLARDGGVKVRALTTDEMSLWWTFIAFDIEEPVFVAESRSHRYIFDLHAPATVQIDDLNNLQEIKGLMR